ncbi:MAG: glutamate-ammonia-ligase adenylyltransferase [Desulfobacterota bacterium]|nr:glutamate-ammonia-ligase adenylyltransferase [Thermodesulfobacteriota bacterium]
MKTAEDRLRAEHLARLGERYSRIFSAKDVDRHQTALGRLSPQHPVEILLDPRKDGTLECTVLAFDYPSEFSLITGILAGMGFSVVSGEVFTDEGIPGIAARRERREKQDLGKRRRIIDHFSGVVDIALPLETWADELRSRMKAALLLLEKGDEPSVTEAKQQVNELVVRRLASLHQSTTPVPYPVEIQVDDQAGAFTRLRVVSEDTPAFLYALSNALSLHDVSIEHVRIRTIHGRVEDEIDLVDLRGRKIQDSGLLNRVKFSVLLTKQFTYFLGAAPDPFTALSRFEQIVRDVVQKKKEKEWLDLLTHPHLLKDLAKLLGASDFLWEDFIRLQYETLLPMLSPYVETRAPAGTPATLTQTMRDALKGARTLEEKGQALNRFKDREIFFIDLDHILHPESTFDSFAVSLTRLAEQVVDEGAGMVYADLTARFGRPRTVAGLEVKYAILGLGKLGGAALGYASDLELLFVYSDSGTTDGDRPITNAEFFDRLVKGVTGLIKSKREGIFHLDLRLRPYGSAGPLASSLDSFCRYYGPEGPSHSYERLALVRLRAIGGDPDLGKQVERLRDEMIYFSGRLDLQELKDLREKQFREKTGALRLNAKFSPGGLVDLEYSVQILQVTYGKEIPSLRTPLVREALEALSEQGVLAEEESARLLHAYVFLRHLINSMRMLRGSAVDLFFPSQDSSEFAHLARRMGYSRGGPLEPSEQLRIDFESHSAAVRVFVERHFGRDSIPGAAAGNAADLVLSDQVDGGTRDSILQSGGFDDPERAYANIISMAGGGSRRATFAKLALLAFDILKRKPDPDMALNNWERFVRAQASADFHYNLLLSQPMRLELLLGIFAGSQFLSDALVRNPGFLDWVVAPEVLHRIRETKDIEEELGRVAPGCSSHGEWLNRLRRMRRREMLRIGIRDICLGASTREVMIELSRVADAFAQAVLERRIRERPEWKDRFCILALGKLGGQELNYSSDIDLLGFWNDDNRKNGQDQKAFFSRLMEDVRSDLSSHTEEGYAYRVDLRLRPFGRDGELVPSWSSLVRYYTEVASLWEIQAALKMRPVAGNPRLGYLFLEKIRPVLLQDRKREDVTRSIERMRLIGVKTHSGATQDVKSGIGGLRDVEFLVQGLQLIHGARRPFLLEGNTLNALELLGKENILPESVARDLKEDYLFLRRVEHCLQILEDRQIHAIPKDRKELKALARRLLGPDGNEDLFREKLEGCSKRIREAYTRYLMEGDS